MAQCRFFAQGLCANGRSCNFIHERNGHGQSQSGCTSSPFQRTKEPNHDHTASHANQQAPGQPQKGPSSLKMTERGESSTQQLHGSRATIPCKNLSLPGGCQTTFCPYLHPSDGQEVKKSSDGDVEMMDVDEIEQQDESFTRELSGASVCYDTVGHIAKVSLPIDFSHALITGLVPGTTPEHVVNMLHGIGINLDVECVHFRSQTSARVTVEDPEFINDLSDRIKKQGPFIRATPIPSNAGKTESRKVCVYWPKATKSVILEFNTFDMASRVARGCNLEVYRLFEQPLRSTTPQPTEPNGQSSTARTWIITLTSVPCDATLQHFKLALGAISDDVRRIEMGTALSYKASENEVSAEVRLKLREHGPLESFSISPPATGKNPIAIAWFHDELDARSACSLDDTSLRILSGARLTVLQAQIAKITVPTPICLSLEGRINEEIEDWEERNVIISAARNRGTNLTRFDIESPRAEDVLEAHKSLFDVLDGIVLTNGEGSIWSPVLHRRGRVTSKIASMSDGLGIVLIRDREKRQVRLCGPPDKSQQVVRFITEMIKEEPITTYEIALKPHQFSWAAAGGFKSIQQILGEDVATFSIQQKKITISGAQEEYLTALTFLDHADNVRTASSSVNADHPKGICPICFCEADSPIQTSCKHTYCLECFEEFCKSASSTSKEGFQIKCEGDEGDCPTVLTLTELEEHLSSSVFETVLKSSFEEYIKRNPGTFHYCPSPDCGYIYRCTTTTPPETDPPPYTCPNCIKAVCTSCHAQHAPYSCADHKDIISGRVAITEAMRKELDIKDCPKCTTSIQKSGGCEKVICEGCKAHICWLCLAAFEGPGPCYAHINRTHRERDGLLLGNWEMGDLPLGYQVIGRGRGLEVRAALVDFNHLFEQQDEREQLRWLQAEN